jgi:hypothetical protein
MKRAVVLLYLLFTCGWGGSPAYANTCSGGPMTIYNDTCDSMLYVFVCYGDKGVHGHGAESIQKNGSAFFHAEPGSTFSAVCGQQADEKCDATWCADGQDHRY